MSDTSAIQLPLLPLRDVVVYPHMVLPLFVGRERSIEALEHAMAGNKQVLLVAQRHAPDDNPDVDDLYQVGTISTILQLLKLPDGTIKVLVEGSERGAIEAIDTGEAFSLATVRQVECVELPDSDSEAAIKETIEHFEKYVKKRLRSFQHRLFLRGNCGNLLLCFVMTPPA